MIYDERISKLRMIEESFYVQEEHNRKCLKEVVKLAENFLKSYGIEEGLLTYDDKKLNAMLEDLNISMREERGFAMTGYILSHHRDYSGIPPFDKFKYSIYLPPETDRHRQREALACAITLKIFREKDEEQFFHFEFPSLSMMFTMLERAFIYGLLMPYTEYIKTFEEFCNKEKEESASLHNVQNINKNWLEYLICSSRETSTCIYNFYTYVFFEEFNKIWNNEILEWAGKILMDTEYKHGKIWEEFLARKAEQEAVEEELGISDLRRVQRHKTYMMIGWSLQKGNLSEIERLLMELKY